MNSWRAFFPRPPPSFQSMVCEGDNSVYIWSEMNGLGENGVWRGLDKLFAQVGCEAPRLRSGFRQRAQTPAKRLDLTNFFAQISVRFQNGTRTNGELAGR